ncbi:MAG: histone deacetylase family protein [bacterium]
MRTGLVYHPDYLLHDMGAYHPENRNRLTAIVDGLKSSGIWEKLEHIQPRYATEEELAYVHEPRYVESIERLCRRGGGSLDPDTSVCPDSYDVAKLAAGGVCAAIDAVMEGVVENAFCAVRPPGHHARPHAAMGFCIFNNIAIGARYSQKHYEIVRKVLIVDWDVHHGNGTQEAFYEDPTVLYFSTHQYPFYPGTGSSEERGRGAGEGFTINVPLPYGSDDGAYSEVFERVLIPAARSFGPDLVMVSAGFDAHRQDPLAGMGLSTPCYGKLTKVVLGIARESCGGRLVSVLEGGYNLDSLSQSVKAHIGALMGEIPNNT